MMKHYWITLALIITSSSVFLASGTIIVYSGHTNSLPYELPNELILNGMVNHASAIVMILSVVFGLLLFLKDFYVSKYGKPTTRIWDDAGIHINVKELKE